MALQTQLKAPNGLDITLPTGLFINNEFVASSSGTKITSVSPAYANPIIPLLRSPLTYPPVMAAKSAPSRLRRRKT